MGDGIGFTTLLKLLKTDFPRKKKKGGKFLILLVVLPFNLVEYVHSI